MTFIALEFPSWLRWGQRRGAFIDSTALAAVFPDHRHRVLVDGAWQRLGTVRRCGWCGRECPKRRTSWCSDVCAQRFYRVWNWKAVADYVFERDGGTCQRCATTTPPWKHSRRDLMRYGHDAYCELEPWWEVDHIVPVRDGGTDEPANLRLVCHPCHIAIGYEQRQAREDRLVALLRRLNEKARERARQLELEEAS